MIEYRTLYRAYKKARRHTRKTAEVAAFEAALEHNLKALQKAINGRLWRATSFYFFIVSKPKIREICAAAFAIRIVHHVIDMAIRPGMEEILQDRTYNNRVDKGTLAAIEQLEEDLWRMTKAWTEEAWVRKIDLTACFPTADTEKAYRAMEELCQDTYHGRDKDDVLWLIRICMETVAQDHGTWKGDITLRQEVPENKALTKQPAGRGLGLGSLLSQDAMALLVNRALSRTVWKLQEDRSINFVDDTTTVSRNKESLLYSMPAIREAFLEEGLKVSDRKFYLQPARHGLEFLGYHIRPGRKHLNRRTVANMVARIEQWNRAQGKHLRAADLIASVNSYIAMLNRSNGYMEIEVLLLRLDPVWWNYVCWNAERRCLQVREQYKRKNQIKRQLVLMKLNHIKCRRYEKTGDYRRKAAAGGQAAGCGAGAARH